MTAEHQRNEPDGIFAPFVIEVPASTSNIAVGYDCLGMAMTLHSKFAFSPADTLTVSGCPEEFCNEDNLVNQAYLKGCDALGLTPMPYAVEIRAQVPVARGLGSSSTCIVAGIMAAGVMAGCPFPASEVIRLATEMEGHPDNAAPAVLGSLVCSFTPEGEEPVCLPLQTSKDLRYVTIIPSYEVKTHEARKVVPTEVPTSTAVWQMGRCTAAVLALQTGDIELLGKACVDKLQEPFRKALIPEYDDVKAAAAEHGGVMWISGSGSTLMAAVKGDEAASELADTLKTMYPDYAVLKLKADTQGATVTSA